MSGEYQIKRAKDLVRAMKEDNMYTAPIEQLILLIEEKDREINKLKLLFGHRQGDK